MRPTATVTPLAPPGPRATTRRTARVSLITLMVVGSAIAAVACRDVIVGISGLAAVCFVLLLRSEEDSAAFLFCLGYQWLFAVSGITYRGLFGKYPSDGLPPSSASILVLLGALLALAVGIWGAMKAWSRSAAWQRRRARLPARVDYSITGLFALVLTLYAGSWATTASPKEIAYSFSQILFALLSFRDVFLFLLFAAVLRQRRGHLLAAIAGVFVMLPAVTTGGSGFASVLFVLLTAILTERRGTLLSAMSGRQRRQVIVLVGVIGFALANLAIMWQGAIKAAWRPIARGNLEASRIERIEMFFDVATRSVSNLNWYEGVESVAKRTSDVPVLFENVWRRVPGKVPHADGELTIRAVKHISMPRFLFPDKENLRSDSAIVSEYAGLRVAGEREGKGTSIGLGYLTEFYIDYGMIGMFCAAFAFGFIVGSIHRAFLFVAPSIDLYYAASATILLHSFLGLDSALAKTIGSLVMSYAVFGAVLLFIGVRLHSWLLLRRY